MWLIVVAAVVIVVLFAAPAAASAYTEWLWFASIGQTGVFVTTITAQVTLFALAFGVFLAITMLNLVIARWVAQRSGGLASSHEGVLVYLSRIESRTSDRIVTFGSFMIAIFLAVVMGAVASSHWLAFLQFLHVVPFKTNDPLFGMDVSFFVFQLPVYRFMQGWFLFAVILTAALTVTYYALRNYGLTVTGADLVAMISTRGIRVHCFSLAAIVSLILAAGYRLDAFDLVYSNRGVVHGAGFADRYAELPALQALTVIAALLAVALIVSGFSRGFTLAGWGVAIWAFVAVLGSGIYPSIVQSYQVQPSELAKERPFLSDNIAMTRSAFDLNSIDSSSFPGEPDPQPGVVTRNPQTFASIRLWDDMPLLDTYQQIQTIRLYYDFNSVDVDRYTVNGQYRQVMVSARELSPAKLAGQAQTWVTQRLQFTHGYGLAMSPVNEVTAEGLPDMLVKDIPPTGSLTVTQPAIYYSDTPASYVVVDTTAQEFDYPKGNDNVYATYSGNSGVVLDSALKRVAFALTYGDPNLVLSGYIQPDSRILYHRDISNRLSRVAPFLTLDSDPYLVLSGGRLFWIQDAYTTTTAYPYSTPSDQGFNYIRNSVKAVTNAYDGSLHLYVADPSDPLIQSYSQIFPGLFSPLSEMPPDLQSHIRYPENIFSIQAEMLSAYHMTDPQVFYNKEDLWDLPREQALDGTRQVIKPYYMILRLPGSEREEFMLMMPFTPYGKNNMVAWLAAQSDPPNYGKLVAFDYPKDTVIFGPQQVQARIDQDPTISQQLTLWNQQGSRVIRGTMLVIPIEKSTIYVEPIYLQANQSQIPELKRVVVATQDHLVMGTSLDDSLKTLFGAPAQPSPSATSPGTNQPSTTTPSTQSAVAQLARSAEDHYQKAQAALKAGDWTTYGNELKAMDGDLQQIVQATSQ